ncbi:MAG TPA: urea amidolyase associated protein UAAP1 [Yinghuangia sp.]|uniref:urea amidolyase associated protein UAAP1 n=1 Tax=Yinghuangia sp. YIM S10712 TaxID=3436930 RepID=UPI002BEEB4B3|nr:urea amidolyase associated protein UAAP1 [Yinghuangia sp.]
MTPVEHTTPRPSAGGAVAGQAAHGLPYAHDIAAGSAWTVRLGRHRALRLTCLDDGANAAVLMFAASDPLERLNLPDTLKAQMSACVRPPLVLMSDMGRALASMTGSSLDWHDAITGHSTDAQVRARFGASDYAADRNAWRRSARAGLLDELWKHGLGKRDLHATLNLFTKVVPAGDERGSLAYVPGHARAGDWVELRAEQDVLVMLSTAPHPMDPNPAWAPARLRADVSSVPEPGPRDPSRVFRPESGRALAAVERSLA